MTQKRETFVWEPDGDGWRKVRVARVPRPHRGRSERVPRPPSFRFHAAGVEGYSARELAEGVRSLASGKNNLRRLMIEVEDLAEAAARVALLPVELLNRHPRAAALLAAWFALKKPRRLR